MEKTKKIWIDGETYDKMQAKAKKLGLTVDEYATKITSEHLKQVKAKYEA